MTRANGPSPRELWEELGSYSTLHGFHFTFKKSSKVRRVVWILLMLGAGGFLANQIFYNFLKVMAHEVVLRHRSETRGSLDFPAISICNNNMFRKSRINGTFAQRYLDLFDSGKIKEWPKLRNGLNYSLDLEDASLQYGHNLTEMMADGKCKWLGRTCSEQNFTKFFEPRYGLCYKFNSGKNGQAEILKVSQTGVFAGFTIILDSQPEEYYGPFSYHGTGFRVIIHDQNEHEAMDKQSVQISPGFNVEMKITRKEFTALEAPYPTRCIKREGYSRSHCGLKRAWIATAQRCGCRLLGSVEENSSKVPFCTPWQVRECVIKIDFVEVLQNIDHECPWRCNHVEYDIQSSFMTFPSESYWELLKTKNNMSRLPNQWDEILKQYKSRYVKLTVYYGETKVDITSEEPVYTTIDLANDLGGSMGLFLGCSVLTVVEFIDVLVLMCIARWRRMKQVNVDVEANEQTNEKIPEWIQKSKEENNKQ